MNSTEYLSHIDTPSVSVLIFTLDEETHLPPCLDSLRWCDDIIVIDSGSTDRTEKICKEHGVEMLHHPFEGFGKQRNWALDNAALKHEWVLILDADERVPKPLSLEINRFAARADPGVGAARVRRRFYMWGRWLRYSSLYPTWVVRLVHRDRVRYVNRGHAETQEVDGLIVDLEHDLIDQNLKGIDEWFARQNRYARADADYELREEARPLNLVELFSADPLTRRAALKRLSRCAPFRPSLFFIYNYVFRLGFLDGRDGFTFCQMKADYQRMVSIRKYDAKRRRNH